jgi:hypothetical protein
MIIHPDDQILDYFVYLARTERARGDIEKFENGYRYWQYRIRKTL